MDTTRTTAGPWTPGRVEKRLIAAFRSLPSQPVFSNGRIAPMLLNHADDAEALGWTRIHVPDRREAMTLLTWARCRATGESVRARYLALGWSRSSAEDARRRALGRIVAGLQRGLDSRTNPPGASSDAPAAPVDAEW